VGFERLVSSLVGVAKSVTSSLQVSVQHEAWIGHTTGFPAPQYAQPVQYQAVVVPGPKPFRTLEGNTIVVDAELFILEPVVANGADGRHEPIDPRDRFKLPDGRKSSPVSEQPERIPLNPTTGRPYAHVVGLKEA